MEPTSFPFEIQFNFLLQLPYEEIINYCQVNQTALNICRSEAFWKMKVDNDNYDPDFLSTIYGPTPAVRYLTLRNILNSDDPISEAIKLGQSDFIQFVWNSEDAHEINPDAIYEAVENGHYKTVGTIIDLIRTHSGLESEVAEEVIVDLFNAAMEFAIDYISIDATLYLSKFTDTNYIDLLERAHDSFSMTSVPQFYDRIFQEGKMNGESRIVQMYGEFLVDVKEHDDLQYLIEHYRNELDLKALFSLSLESCPTAKMLSRFVIS